MAEEFISLLIFAIEAKVSGLIEYYGQIFLVVIQRKIHSQLLSNRSIQNIRLFIVCLVTKVYGVITSDTVLLYH